MSSTILLKTREINNMLEFDRGITGVQSPWIIEVYSQYFKDNHDGFLVEIGVGHTVDWRAMGMQPSSACSFDWENAESIITCGNHTLELIMQGWTGIYIDSLSEFLDYELEPLLKKVLDKKHFKKIKLVRCGAAEKRKIVKIDHHENLIDCEDGNELDQVIPYEYHLHGGRKLVCEKTSVILEENNCPSSIDLMVIDVEGFEENVLRGLDFSKYTPKLIFIEVDKCPITKVQELLPEDYIVSGNDGLNALFVHKDFYQGPIQSSQHH